MDRIANTFSECRAQGRAAFVSYVCAGDPDFDTSVEVCRSLIDNGTDVLELGVPFSDPLADGLTNQLAAQRALESGMTREKVFALVRKVREFAPDTPIVFYTYYNLVFSPGMEAYCQDAADAGVDALLTLDCPPEEADELQAALAKAGLRSVFIVAPTTPESRIATIAEAATGFLYYVSRTGVTGERDSMAVDLGDAVARIKKHAGELPVVVGFGISKPEHVSEVGAVCDGVVVGSALVNTIKANLETRSAIPAAIGEKLSHLRSGLA